MGIFNPFKWGVKASPEIKSHSRTLDLGSELSSFILFGRQNNPNTPGNALRLFRESTAVSIPVNYIATSFASIRPVLKELETNTITRSAPILELLTTPSENFSANLFLQTIAMNYLITGNTYIIAVGNINRAPLELMPISPQNISVIEGENGAPVNMDVGSVTFPGSYAADTRKKKVRYIRDNLTELKQIRNFSTRNNSLLQGESVLVSASAEVRQNIEGNNHNVALLTNGGYLSLVFAYKEDMSADDFAATKERIKEQYEGSRNAGQVAVTTNGTLSIHELGTSNKDMDFAILQQAAKQAVALQYKFPLPLLSTDASTFNNYETAKTALFDDAVLPVADVIFGGLSTWLLPRFGVDPAKFQITYDIDQITALAGRRQSELKLRKELGVETTNEIRTLIGKEPLEGGDTLMVPATLIPLGTDIFTDDNIPANAIDRDDA